MNDLKKDYSFQCFLEMVADISNKEYLIKAWVNHTEDNLGFEPYEETFSRSLKGILEYPENWGLSKLQYNVTMNFLEAFMDYAEESGLEMIYLPDHEIETPQWDKIMQLAKKVVDIFDYDPKVFPKLFEEAREKSTIKRLSNNYSFQELLLMISNLSSDDPVNNIRSKEVATDSGLRPYYRYFTRITETVQNNQNWHLQPRQQELLLSFLNALLGYCLTINMDKLSNWSIDDPSWENIRISARGVLRKFEYTPKDLDALFKKQQKEKNEREAEQKSAQQTCVQASCQDNLNEIAAQGKQETKKTSSWQVVKWVFWVCFFVFLLSQLLFHLKV